MLPVTAAILLLTGCRVDKDPMNPARSCQFTAETVDRTVIVGTASFANGESHVPFGYKNIKALMTLDEPKVSQEAVDRLVDLRKSLEGTTLTNWYSGKTFLIERNGKILAAGAGTCTGEVE